AEKVLLMRGFHRSVDHNNNNNKNSNNSNSNNDNNSNNNDNNNLENDDLQRFWKFFDSNSSDATVPSDPECGYWPRGLFYPGLRAFPDNNNNTNNHSNHNTNNTNNNININHINNINAAGALPFTGPDAYPGLPELLRARSEAIRQEVRDGNPESFEQVRATNVGWGMQVVRQCGQPTADHAKHLASLPSTMSLLQELDSSGWLAPESAKLLRQSPGTGLNPHCDCLNMVLCCHLGLIIPSASSEDLPWIECGGVRRHWAEGEAMVFDQSFVHSTFNPTSEDRVVLAIDLWHHDLSMAERAALSTFFDFIDSWNLAHCKLKGVHHPEGLSVFRNYAHSVS
ncbi:unnamed protein product, partial [Polarella glacialis]